MEVSELLSMINMWASHMLHQAIFGQEMGCSTPSIFSKSTFAMMYVKRVQKLTRKRVFHQSMLELEGLLHDFITI